MAFNLSGGFAAGQGSDALEDLLKRVFVEQQAKIRTQQEQQRIEQDDRRLKMQDADRAAAMNDLAKSRAVQNATKLTGMLRPGQTVGAGTVDALKSGDLGDLVQHDAADLPSTAISGIAQAGAKTPIMGSLRMAAAGRPERDTFTGTDEQLTAEQTRKDALAAKEQARQDLLAKDRAKPTTQPVMRVNPRTGQMQQMGDAPVGAHFITEPAPPQAAGGRSLSPTAEANLTTKLAADWNNAVKPSREMERQYQLMQSGLDRFDRDPNGASQAVLVTFQKILDPTSVVRESEYARSASGVSLMQRMQGYAEKLAAGGAGVPKEALNEMVKTADEFLRHSRKSAEGQRKRIAAFADKYSIPHELVFDDADAVPAAGGAPAAGGPKETPEARIKRLLGGG